MRHERCRPRAGARPPRVARSLRKLRRRRRQRHHTSATAVSRLSTRTRRLHQALPVSVLSSADTQVNDTHRLYECQIENIACSVITSEEQRSRKRPMRYCVSHGCIDDIRGSSDDRQCCADNALQVDDVARPMAGHASTELTTVQFRIHGLRAT